MEDSRRQFAHRGEEDDLCTSPIQLRLAASVLGRVVEQNGGCAAGSEFWEEDSLDIELDQEQYSDPESWDPDYETLPEMAIINENIFGGL